MESDIWIREAQKSEYKTIATLVNSAIKGARARSEKSAARMKKVIISISNVDFNSQTMNIFFAHNGYEKNPYGSMAWALKRK